MGSYYPWINAIKRKCFNNVSFAYDFENCYYLNDHTNAALVSGQRSRRVFSGDIES